MKVALKWEMKTFRIDTAVKRVAKKNRRFGLSEESGYSVNEAKIFLSRHFFP